MALVSFGSKSVKWHGRDPNEKFPIQGISAVVLSWFISPLMAGMVSMVFFGFARTFILRHENSYDRAFWFLPVLLTICTFINSFYVLDKGINKQCAAIPLFTCSNSNSNGFGFAFVMHGVSPTSTSCMV
jgi:phosphate/sulfate permease